MPDTVRRVNVPLHALLPGWPCAKVGDYVSVPLPWGGVPGPLHGPCGYVSEYFGVTSRGYDVYVCWKCGQLLFRRVH